MEDVTVVIAGGSGGLGQALSLELKEYSVIGTYHRSNVYADETFMLAHRERVCREPDFHQVDIRDREVVKRFVDTVSPSLKKVCLVNFAGVNMNGMAHEFPMYNWDIVLQANLRGAFILNAAFLPLMREEGWGRIVNVSSIVGQKGIPGTVAYAASKGGVEAMTRVIAVENAKKGITANTLGLGYFNVGIIDTVPKKLQEGIKENIPMGCFGHPKNIAEAVRFLIKADYVTGATININGGLS